jgi:hypothetical protein
MLLELFAELNFQLGVLKVLEPVLCMYTLSWRIFQTILLIMPAALT